MGYAIMRIEKAHANSVNTRYKHNYRQYSVDNADMSKSYLNRELIELNGKTYQDAYEDTLLKLKQNGAVQPTIRGDAIRGIEIVCEFSREDMNRIDLETWAKDNIEWLDKSFNPPEHKAITSNGDIIKTNNVVSAVLHMDEAKPHIHAYVIPIDDKGCLNGSYYVGKREKLIELQNTYAEKMKVHGLERGTKNSIARAEDMNKYYDALKKTVEAKLPDVKQGETALEYKKRADEIYARECIHHRNQIVKERQKYVEVKGVSLEEKMNFKKEKGVFEKEIKKLKKIVGKDELSREDVRDIRKTYKEHKQFEQALKDYPDTDTADTINQAYQRLLLWQQERELEAKRKEEQRRKEKEGEEKDSIKLPK